MTFTISTQFLIYAGLVLAGIVVGGFAIYYLYTRALANAIGRGIGWMLALFIIASPS